MSNKVFDFNSLDRLSIEVTLCDPQKTVIHVTTPTEGTIERLASAADDLVALSGASSEEKVRASYKLCADILSCNVEGLTITAEELRDKYNIKPITLAGFTAVYLDFINEFKNAKN